MPNDMTLAFADARRGGLDCRPKPVCDPRPVCPACGGLECLCRPRFFAGQLLSEEDLNRLDHYIVAKNRLHNRHLFGSGVVCGLEVVCNTCDPAGSGTVIVRPGYALSPCGNDIVVCCDEAVNICDLINRCRPRHDDCIDPHDRPHVPDRDDDADRGDEEWVLAICYQERLSRGITALRGSSCSCGGSCGCGGTHGHGCSCGGGHTKSAPPSYTSAPEASCGCGGGGGTTTAATKPAAKRGPTPPQCEPTLICEGYTFAVYRAPKKDQRPRDPGALIRRFICCFQPLWEQVVKLPPGNANTNQRQQWLQSLIATLREFLLTEGLYDCDIAARLAAIVLPPTTDAPNVYLTKWNAATLSVFAIMVAIFQKCLCAALLPPCPPPEMHDCVPLAAITIARGRCRVRHICNLRHRKFLMTFPAISYWLSWLPIFTEWQQAQQPAGRPKTPTIQELIDALCCTPIFDLFNFADPRALNLTAPLEAAVARPLGPAAAQPAVHPFSQLLVEAFTGAPQKANAATVLLAAMGARYADGSPLVSDLTFEHPGEAILIQQVLAPALESLLPIADPLRRGGEAAAIGALRTEVDGLRETIRRQQEAITRLEQR
jgi:hypothetical protein